VLFLDIFLSKSFQEYVIQWVPAKCQTDGSFGKQTVVEVIYSIFKGLRI